MVHPATIYEPPTPTALLTISSFLFLINAAEAIFERLINAGLIGSLTVGIIYGPQVADILPEGFIASLIQLGYVGLILLVFEAGLTTNTRLLIDNLLLSIVAASTGIVAPIGLSLLLLHVGYGYPLLQSFAAGAALSSTSLGTTLALLKPEYRQTRTGAVLLSAALLDDVVGLVIAAIITELSGVAGAISWQTIVRPILVSIAFVAGTPVLAYLMSRMNVPKVCQLVVKGYQQELLLFMIVITLSGFVSGAHYAGTSDLFGAYLAGLFLNLLASGIECSKVNHTTIEAKSRDVVPPPSTPASSQDGLFTSAFSRYILPTLQVFLSPIFFASIGTALPIRALGFADESHAVVWRGIVYAILMFLAKVLVGIWMLLWSAHEPSNSSSAPFTRYESCMLLGLAMVARGEIALIVAQLARPILTQSGASEEAYVVVIWAILICTVGGAICVGVFLRTRYPKIRRSTSI